MCQPVDKRIIYRIHELVADGTKDVNQVRHQVELFVKNVLFRDKELPKTTNRRFYPTTKDIRTHVYQATVKNRKSSQESSVPDQLASSTDTPDVSMVDHELPIMESSVSVVELPISNVTFETIQANAVGLSAGVDPQVEGQKCRDLLEQMKQLTFVVQDEEVLARLNSRLQELLDETQLFCCVGQCR